MLLLILAAAVRIAHLTGLVALKEKHLRAAFSRIDLCGQRSGIGKLQRHIALPLGLKRRHVHDDAASRIGRLPEAHRKHIPGNPEVLHRARESERIGRNDTDIGLHINKGCRIEILRIHNRRIDVGEDL